MPSFQASKLLPRGFAADETASDDNARGDARALKVTRRVHDAAYTRMAGSPDSATPYTDDRQEAPPYITA